LFILILIFFIFLLSAEKPVSQIATGKSRFLDNTDPCSVSANFENIGIKLHLKINANGDQFNFHKEVLI
jgi:hypothetical protein